MIGGGVALVLIVGIALLAMRGDGSVGGILPPILGTSEPPPEFNFEVVKVAAKPTGPTKASDLADRVEPVGAQIASVLDGLYLATFVDPATWEGGDYGDAFGDAMDDAAAEQANASVEALTLGADAGTTYESVDPVRATLTVTVLTDPKDDPKQAIGTVSFTGLAEHDDGTYTKVISSGTYLFHKVDGSWEIISFDVDRDEKAAKAPATASASASAETSAEASG